MEEVTLDHRLAGLRSTYELIGRTAERMPEKIAFYFLRTGRVAEAAIEISYAQLFARLTRTANLFHDLGIRSGDVVSYLLPNLPETHYILWGAEAAGIANPINPQLDSDHIIAIMTAARSRILVIEASLMTAEKLSQIREQVPTLRHIIQLDNGENPIAFVLHYEEIIDRYRADRLDSARRFQPQDICALFHTGGTTGAPKMARHSHYNELATAMMTDLAIRLMPEDGLCGLPLFHVNGAILTGLVCFLRGATVVIATPAGFRTPDLIVNFWQIIAKYRVTFFSGVPTIYSMLLQVPVGGADISALRLAICGAAPMPRDIIGRFEAATGIVLIEGYGMTEGTCVSSCNPLYGERRAGSVGLRLPYQQQLFLMLRGNIFGPVKPTRLARLYCGDQIFSAAICSRRTMSEYGSRTGLIPVIWADRTHRAISGSPAAPKN
ncbi:MAG: AMP-binding protein [Alphaproteobacteria bacterium]|nr:AMP-binding protein [Alphaproteobacteria bacterium]